MSSQRRFTSGAQKRKQKASREENLQKVPKITAFLSDKDCSSSAETSQTFNNTSSTAVNTESNSIVTHTSFTADTDSIVANTSFTADIQPCSISTDTSSFASTSTIFNTDSESHSIAGKTNVSLTTAIVAPPSSDPALITLLTLHLLTIGFDVDLKGVETVMAATPNLQRLSTK